MRDNLINKKLYYKEKLFNLRAMTKKIQHKNFVFFLSEAMSSPEIRYLTTRDIWIIYCSRLKVQYFWSGVIASGIFWFRKSYWLRSKFFLETDSGTINGVRNEFIHHALVKQTPRDCEAIGSLFVFGTHTVRRNNMYLGSKHEKCFFVEKI